MTDERRVLTDELAALQPQLEVVDGVKVEEPHPSFGVLAPDRAAIERVWSTYWMPLLRGEDGRFSMEKLKAELFDAYFLVDNARAVYRHVTAGVTDDLTASAEGIIAMAERQVARRIAEAVAADRREKER